MNKLNVRLDNCYGIGQMEHEFDFSESNVIAIYARNGLMKTSLAKTFRSVQDGKTDEVKDEIFNRPGSVEILMDGASIPADNIFVIKSFESSYQSDITPLLINSTIKTLLKDVLKARDKLFKALENCSGLKVKRTQAGKVVYELEPTLINDFLFSEDSFLVNMLTLRDLPIEANLSNVQYADIFDPSVLKKIRSDDFQNKIREFITRSDEIYSSYAFLEKGQLTLPKLRDTRKSLEKNCFFVRGNGLVLCGTEAIPDLTALIAKIGEIEETIKSAPEFQAIEQMLSDAKGTVLRDVIEATPELINWLTIDRLPSLKKTLWLSYLDTNKSIFSDLCKKYEALSQEIDAVALDDTPWEHALDIYKKRFSVPYEMEVSNLKGAIIGESIPRIEFSFSKDGQKVVLSRDRLEELDTLSQGEKRALYLLNVIFDIEQIKRSDKETLFIIDDIADSFDYKNKYAIVEYIYELAQNNRFSMMVLSHNFDFYRTISSRIGLKRNCRLCADANNGIITLLQEHYQNQPFEQWKENLTAKNVIALIPFVRNLVEYGNDRHIGNCYGNTADYNLLTFLLHEKPQTPNITYGDLVIVYKEYLGVIGFKDEVDLQGKIIDSLYEICDGLSPEDNKLENKIVLAIAIRHKAEVFMISHIKSYNGRLSWRNSRRNVEEGTPNQFLEVVLSKTNQTRELLNGYKQFGSEHAIHALEEVNIMTPENIHLNSFMYEPILDMDIVELMNLYRSVKQLTENL